MSRTPNDRSLEKLLQEALALDPPSRERLLFEKSNSWEHFERLLRRLTVMEARARDKRRDGESATHAPRDADTTEAQDGSAPPRFEIVDVLGEGAAGIVYLADQTEPIHRRVALKVFKRGAESAEAVHRFEAERQILAQMNHANIARVYEAGTTPDGRLYFAMEAVRGRSITEFCNERRLDLSTRLRLIAAVCDAVQHAHNKGVIHHDIKPSNILVSDEGGIPVPKIIDFGVARRADEVPTGTTLFARDHVAGSLGYVSPERLSSSSARPDTRSDVYSLGVVLYELVTGVHPLGIEHGIDTGLGEIERRLFEQDPQRPSDQYARLSQPHQRASERDTTRTQIRRAIRTEIDWVCLRALARDPQDRYQSASEMSEDIRRWLDGRPVEARPPRARERVGQVLRRHRVAVATTAAALVSLALGISATGALIVKNRRFAAAAHAQNERILSLSDASLLEKAREEAESFLPPHPSQAGAMEAWLDGPANDLLFRAPRHRARLEELSATIPSQSAGGQFADAETQLEYDLLTGLVSELRRFEDPDPHAGTVADVRQRLAFAREVRMASIDAHADAWSSAVASIADPKQCPLYRGLRVPPQIGLIPVRRDPASGLWEFLVYGTGETPGFEPGGPYRLTAETGIVLVLIPGGSFWMGATAASVGLEGVDDINPYVKQIEGPPNRVRLDPFFVSKYEVTQGQWLRITGRNPSRYRSGTTAHGVTRTLVFPVEYLTWREAFRALRRVGLEIPTEAQWEYMARAGASTHWPCGDDPDCIARYANLCDMSSYHAGAPRTWPFAPWNDGFPDTSPVGAFLPNDWGIYDALGNVEEFTSDWVIDYANPTRDGTGERIGDGDRKSTRGSSARGSRFFGRPSLRIPYDVDTAGLSGVRPARRLDWGATGEGAQP